MSQLFHTSSSLFLRPLFFFFFLVFARSINGAVLDNQTFPNCPVYICNGVTISYPFWRQDETTSSQLQYCGYPQFGINCSTGTYPIIRLPGDAYYVKGIDYESHNISLVDIDAADQSCPRVRHRIDIQSLPLNFIAGLNVNLSFLFDCTELPPFATPIPCLSHGPMNHSCVYVEGTETEEFNWTHYCSDQVSTTVLSSAINLQGGNSLDNQFSSALSEGFMLNWGTVEDCGKCEASGGRCGNNTQTSRFKCFCKDGTSTKVDCGGGTKWVLKLIVGLSSAAFTVVFMCLFFFFYQRRNKRKCYAHSSYTSRDISSYCSSTMDLEKPETYHGARIFTYNELDKATNHFDSKKELGDGGFGTVYYGKLNDGREVAVKRLYENNYRRVEQFRNEVEILARLQHPNLVRLYGCTTYQSRELLLVYEYIPNGTVADHLHGEKRANNPTLTWTRRLNIAIETATALAYLHASDVIHRDIKTNNILLDDNFGVKVADFGLSRLFPNNVTHVSTAPQGTPGYVDPEYHQCYHLTDKSDVYSFGVVLIELISSMPAVDITRHRHEINLSNMAINKIKDDALDELVDPSLGFSSDYKLRKMIGAVAELAFQCLQNGRDMRPCMDEVVNILKEIRSDDQDPEQEKKQKKYEEMDEAVLLKNNPEVSSPDTVHVIWASTSSASNSSGCINQI